jgi:hypothetical protein
MGIEYIIFVFRRRGFLIYVPYQAKRERQSERRFVQGLCRWRTLQTNYTCSVHKHLTLSLFPSPPACSCGSVSCCIGWTRPPFWVLASRHASRGRNEHRMAGPQGQPFLFQANAAPIFLSTPHPTPCMGDGQEMGDKRDRRDWCSVTRSLNGEA